MVMSVSKYTLPVVVACLVSSGVFASDSCDSDFTRTFHDCVRIVDSLRPEKAGQMRVFASDGSEFNAGQAQWMKGRLRAVERACARGDQAEAAKILADVQELLKSHRRAS
jgi:hypothetical protein